MSARTLVRASTWARDQLKQIAEEDGVSISEIIDLALLRFCKDRALVKSAEVLERALQSPETRFRLLEDYREIIARWRQ